MSDLCKVEMSVFVDGRGPHGEVAMRNNGVNSVLKVLCKSGPTLSQNGAKDGPPKSFLESKGAPPATGSQFGPPVYPVLTRSLLTMLL
jgi:hypothetical protein